jgi:hypothetical protein
LLDPGRIQRLTKVGIPEDLACKAEAAPGIFVWERCSSNERFDLWERIPILRKDVASQSGDRDLDVQPIAIPAGMEWPGWSKS